MTAATPHIFGRDIIDDETVNALAVLMESTWPGYGALFKEEMALYRAHPAFFHPYYALAKNGEQVIGFGVLLDSIMSTSLLAISWVAMHADFQRRGIGQAVIELCLAEAKRRRKPVVLSTDVPAFYLPQGFVTVVEYDRDTKHFLMIRHLEEAS